jgi:hypothetical protein
MSERECKCLPPEDCTESYYPAFKEATLRMDRAQGGIVGWTANSSGFLRGMETVHG